MEGHLQFPILLWKNFHVVWTFLLLTIRYGSLMMFIPGIGGGQRGMTVRWPAVLVLTFASMAQGPYADFPPDWAAFFAGIISELIFGLLLGVIPLLLISGIQMAAGLATTTMGLGAGQLMDPTLGISVPSLGRLMGDVITCVFMLTGGHRTIIYIASGLGGKIIPGTYLVDERSIGVLIDRTAEVFNVAVMVSAPVIVAILLTKFVMGLISRAVPQVNIFIVSFPLTIGVGLVLSMLALPELVEYSLELFKGMDGAFEIISSGNQMFSP